MSFLARLNPFPSRQKSAPVSDAPAVPDAREAVPMPKAAPPAAPNPFAWQTKVYEFLQYWKGFTLQKLGTFQAYLKGITKQVWIAWKCADLIASVLLSVTITVKKGDTELKNSPLSKLLKRPNKWQTWEEFIYLWTFHMLGTGNVYWLKDEFNLLGQPTALFNLNPKYVVIHTDPKNKVSRYEYRVNGKSIYYGADEIIHFQRPNPDDEQLGLGEMEAAQKLMEEFIARDEITANFMNNGGAPAGILVNEDPNAADNPTDWKKKKAEWEAKYWGKKAVGRVGWLAGVWKYLKIGVDSKEFNDIERGKYSEERVMMVFGVPKSLIMGGSANYATARVEERNFRKYKCAPMVVLLVTRINVDLAPLFGPDVRCDYTLAGLEDLEQIGKDLGWLFDRAGLTVDDLRKAAGYAPTGLPEHTCFYMKTGYVPVESVGLTLPTEEEIAASNADLRTDNRA